MAIEVPASRAALSHGGNAASPIAARRIGQSDTHAQPRFGLSVIIPVYNGSATIEPVVREIFAQFLDKRVEVVLVNDGSADNSQQVCAALVEAFPGQVALVQLARNFGEHNAVMAGLRQCRGDYAAVMDDDGQHAAADVRRMLHHARQSGLDVVYGRFRQRRHTPARVLGSWAANGTARVLLHKPAGLYLSSFKVLSRFAIDEICQYHGPAPYVDALVLRVTDRIAQLDVEHRPRAAGRSGYNFSRLLALWLTIAVEYSFAPLRAAILGGFALALLGSAAMCVLVGARLLAMPAPAWAWIASAAALFAGMQLAILGVLGEYASRLMMHHSGMPQQVVRSVACSGDDADHAPFTVNWRDA